MKKQEEIEQLAEQWFNNEILFKDRFYTNSKELRKGYEKGYTQCQEDNKDKKYTEEDMKKCWNACYDFNKPAGLDSGINYQDYIISLNKQDNEELKQETLEEVAERYGKQVLDERKSKNLSIDEEIWLSGGSIVGFIDGAKWQQDMADKKYTLDDMKKACACGIDIVTAHDSEGNDFKLFEDLINSLNKQD